MSKLVYGVGINDADYRVHIKTELPRSPCGKRKQQSIWICPFYDCWKGMLRRCYSTESQTRLASYVDCVVCEEWLTFSNFKSWMERQDWKGRQLDKDLCGNGKMYSPENCTFVSGTLNTFLVQQQRDRQRMLWGTTFKPKLNKYMAQCNNPFTGKKECLGYFLDPSDAHNAWVERKIQLAMLFPEVKNSEKISIAIIKYFRGDYAV